MWGEVLLVFQFIVSTVYCSSWISNTLDRNPTYRDRTKVGRWDIRDQRKNRNRGKRKTRGNTYEVRKFDHPGPGYIALRHRRSLLTHAVLSHRHGHLLFVRVWEVGSSSGMIFFCCVSFQKQFCEDFSINSENRVFVLCTGGVEREQRQIRRFVSLVLMMWG